MLLHQRHEKLSGLESANEGEDLAEILAIPPRVPLPGNPRMTLQRRKHSPTKDLFAWNPDRADGSGGRNGGTLCTDDAGDSGGGPTFGGGRPADFGGDLPAVEDNGSLLHLENNERTTLITADSSTITYVLVLIKLVLLRDVWSVASPRP